ncbi:MAG: helix-turn-helix transcriptional regulator [Treponema sp.]|nr:helix-turn-helix transcriptional regulator [Candidatus Treponema equifaecale]
MGFSENFREELNYQGISLKEFSRMSGISLSTLGKYNVGLPTVPNLEIAQKISTALNVSLDYLVKGVSTQIEDFSPEVIEMAKKMRKFSASDLEAVNRIISAIDEKYKN